MRSDDQSHDDPAAFFIEAACTVAREIGMAGDAGTAEQIRLSLHLQAMTEEVARAIYTIPEGIDLEDAIQRGMAPASLRNDIDGAIGDERMHYIVTETSRRIAAIMQRAGNLDRNTR